MFNKFICVSFEGCLGVLLLVSLYIYTHYFQLLYPCISFTSFTLVVSFMSFMSFMSTHACASRGGARLLCQLSSDAVSRELNKSSVSPQRKEHMNNPKIQNYGSSKIVYIYFWDLPKSGKSILRCSKNWFVSLLRVD